MCYPVGSVPNLATSLDKRCRYLICEHPCAMAAHERPNFNEPEEDANLRSYFENGSRISPQERRNMSAMVYGASISPSRRA